MKKLSQLIDTDLDIEVVGIVDDSRLVEKNFLFVATKGYNVNHFDYIEDAIKNGCCAIICDKKYSCSVPTFVVDDINNFYKSVCLKFYDLNLDYFNFIGITGTDGKTTTASIISQLMPNCAYIGTNGVVVNKIFFPTSNTTPCVSELYYDLSKIKSNNVSNIVMEVSSEALLHKRVDNLKYKIVGFTNITGDHLNVHKSFENYVKSKLELLNLLDDNSFVLVNGDDNILQNIKCKNIYTYGFNNDCDFMIFDVNKIKKNVKFSVKYNNQIFKLESPLKGIFNVYNVVLAFAVCLLYGVDSKCLIDSVKKIKSVDGRCEFLNFGQKFDVVLDYAHTINGIRNILNTFSDYNQIITVTGCAGGRDSSKRRNIGKIVLDNSDISIFTMDDPRNESVDKIIDEMVGDSNDYIRIVDRKEAIEYALSIASDDSVVLILGKGRDNYMAIGDKKIYYSDFDVIKNFFDK